MLNIQLQQIFAMNDQHWSSHPLSTETSDNNRNGNNNGTDHHPINNNNQPIQNDSNNNVTDHTESGDCLNEWEYLTTTYDKDDCIMDDHSISTSTKPNDSHCPQNMMACANQHLSTQQQQQRKNPAIVVPSLSSLQQQFDILSNARTNASFPSQPSERQNVNPTMQNNTMMNATFPMMPTVQYNHNQIAFSHEVSRSLIPTSSAMNTTTGPAINYNNFINEHSIWHHPIPSSTSEQSLASTLHTANYYNRFQPSQPNTIDTKVEACSKLTDQSQHQQSSQQTHLELFQPSMSKSGKKVAPASYKRQNAVDAIDNLLGEMKRKADNHVANVATLSASTLFESAMKTSTTRSSPSSASSVATSGTSNTSVNVSSHQHIKELPECVRKFIMEQPELPPHQQHGNEKLLLKPLTPYNYYYREERDNIILQISDEYDPLPLPVSDFSERKMLDLLYQRWYVDPMKKKRPHRKTHGKMGFQVLSKKIAERWSQLPIEGKNFYRTISRYDDIFYREQLKKIKERQNK